MDDQMKELETWFPENKLTLANGTIIDLPKLSWGRESRAIKVVLSIINQTPELKDIFKDGTFDVSKLTIVIPRWIEQFSEKVAILVGELTGKKPAEVEETFSTEDVLVVLSYFFKRLAVIVRKAGGQVIKLQSLPSSTSAPVSTVGQ